MSRRDGRLCYPDGQLVDYERVTSDLQMEGWEKAELETFGAINVNVQDDEFESMVANLDRDKTYVVHCTMNPGNGRSSRALETLQSLGFKNLYSLEGGYVAWKEAELPLSGAEN